MPSKPSKLTDPIQRLSRAIISEEWKSVSSEAIKEFMYTLPLENYVPSKGGQPIIAMVKSSINRNIRQPKIYILVQQF